LPAIWAGGYAGSLQLAKAGGDSNIWRNFEIEFNFAAGFVATQEYRGVLHIGNFSGGADGTNLSANFRHNRYYNFRIRNNPYNAIAVTLNNALAHDYQDNIFFNGEISGNLAALHAKPDGPHANGVQIYNCVVKDRLVRGSKTYSIGEYEKAFPHLASGNTDGKTAPAMRPLGRVKVAATNATILTLDDARAISDGNRRIAGDTIQIGQQVTQVTERLSATQVRVKTPVTVNEGDAVWLESWKVIAPQPQPQPQPEPAPQPVPEPQPEPIPEPTPEPEPEPDPVVVEPVPVPPPDGGVQTVTITIQVPAGVEVKVNATQA
jgi:hypothetical protein